MYVYADRLYTKRNYSHAIIIYSEALKTVFTLLVVLIMFYNTIKCLDIIQSVKCWFDFFFAFVLHTICAAVTKLITTETLTKIAAKTRRTRKKMSRKMKQQQHITRFNGHSVIVVAVCKKNLLWRRKKRKHKNLKWLKCLVYGKKAVQLTSLPD